MSIREGQEMSWRNALKQITKSLECQNRKFKLVQKATGNTSLHRFKQVRIL